MDFKEIVELALEKKQLEDAYGNLSCLEYPEQYERMGELASEIRDSCMTETVNMNDVTVDAMVKVVEEIAYDIAECNISASFDDLEFIVMTRDAFIDDVVLCGKDEGESNAFWNLYRYVGIDTRVGFLKQEYIDGTDEHYYHNYNLALIVEVREA